MQVQIELTNACNAHCVICPNRLQTRAVTHMDLGLLHRIVDEIKKEGLATRELPVGLCGLGEPTLHPQFKECVEIFSNGIPWSVGSNMSLVDKDTVDFLINKKFTTFSVSLDGVTKKTYEDIRAGLDYDTVLQNTEYFIKQLDEYATKYRPFWTEVYLQFVVTEWNKNEIQPFFKAWEPKIQRIPNCFISFKPICPWPDRFPTNKANILFPGPTNIEIFKHPKVVWGYYDKPFKLREGCSMASHWVQIMSDGTYSICCMNSEDHFEIGNVKNNTIMELFNSPVTNRYKKLQKEGRYDEIPFCDKCI